MAAENRKESLRHSFLYNIAYQVVTVLSPLIVTPWVSRVFGVEYIGIKSYTYSIVYYFAIFGVLGLDMYGQRKIAIVKDDFQNRCITFSNIYFARFSLVLLSTLLYLAYCRAAPYDGIEKTVTLCWLFYLIREMVNPIWFLQGMEKFRIISVLGIISHIAYMACTVLFVKQKSDLPLYIIFYTVIPLAVSLCFFPAVFKLARFVKPTAAAMRLAVKESATYFVPTIATAVYSMVDKTMLGFFDPGKGSTGLYESSERLVKVALAFSTASFTIMRTRMSYLLGKKDMAAYRTAGKQFISFSLMLCWPIMFGIIGISKDFVPVFFGDGFKQVVFLSYVFSLVIPCLTISGLLQAIFIVPFDLQKSMHVYYGVIVFVNVLLNIILIKRFGTVGAIIASIAAEFLLAVILLVKAREAIEIRFIFSASVRYLLASALMLVLMETVSSRLSTAPIIALMIEFICAAASYFVFCIVLGDSFVIKHTKRVLALLAKFAGRLFRLEKAR